MTSIADSDAYRDNDRLLPQHQAALTLLQARLADPSVAEVHWLDLACGRGQIIAALQENMSSGARLRMSFWGYDIDQRYARDTEQLARTLGFLHFDVKVGELADFTKLYESERRFDFITLTNTIHEIDATRLATVLIDAVLRLGEVGVLFIYDMEQITPSELGAVPWTRDEARVILSAVLQALGDKEYSLEVARWRHRSCNAWNAQIQRKHLSFSDENGMQHRDEAVVTVSATIVGLLRSKLSMCRASLEQLTRFGTETAQEEGDKQRLLYDFWAISRSLGDLR